MTVAGLKRPVASRKNGLPAKVTLWYASGDATRRDLAQAVRAMLKPIGIDVDLKSGSWKPLNAICTLTRRCSGGAASTQWSYTTTTAARPPGVEYYNPGYYQNPVVDRHLQQALDAPTWQQAVPHWQQVEWDGKTGAGVKGDAAWAWLLNVQHTYLANQCVTWARRARNSWFLVSSLPSLDGWKWTCK